MELPGILPSRSQSQRASSDLSSARDPLSHLLLCGPQRLSVASAATRLPPCKSVYHYFRFWRLDGTWQKMHAALLKRVRVRLKRNPQPSAGILDSQSLKTTGVGAEERG
jgi:transposase